MNVTVVWQFFSWQIHVTKWCLLNNCCYVPFYQTSICHANEQLFLFWWLSWFDIFMCLLGYDLIVFDWQALCGGERGTSRGGVVVLLKVYGEKQETSQAWQGAGQGPGPREGEEENDVNSWVREWDSTSENKKNDVNSCQRMRLSKKKNIWTCVREQGSAR